MGESLTEQCSVNEEGLRIVKFCPCRREVDGVTAIYRTVGEEEAPANYVPAAAVIRMVQALSGFTGCKGCVGGMASQK